jgi:hypothetical protein
LSMERKKLGSWAHTAYTQVLCPDLSQGMLLCDRFALEAGVGPLLKALRLWGLLIEQGMDAIWGPSQIRLPTPLLQISQAIEP